jgi:predicted anti-sigma-YlaC factor YlaD
MKEQDDKASANALDRRGQNECARFRESISASLDAEDTDIRDAAIDDHLNQCVGCRNFFEFSASLKRAGIRRAPSMTDLAPSIVKRFNVGQPRSLWSIARGVLAICAVEVIVFSLFDLVGGTHESRHLGSFSIAFGVVLLSVVVRPVRARLMFPVTGVLALSLMITAIVDMINGSIPLVTEARHIPEMISVAMMWLLAKPQRTRFSRTSRGVSWSPTIVRRKSESA